MQLISLPVAPITRCIMISDFGSEPITPSRKHLIWQKLHYSSGDHDSQSARIDNALTTFIDIIVPNSLVDHLDRYHLHVGYHLYITDIERMMHFTAALKSAGIPAMTALKMFYEKHGIGEDDFALESAYKRWQRFFPEKPHFHLKITPRMRVLNSNENLRQKPVNISEAIGHFIRKNYESFFYPQGHVNLNLVRKTIIYFLIQYNRIKVSELAKKNKLTIQTVYYHVADMQKKLASGQLRS
jgi:hypothetical protein